MHITDISGALPKIIVWDGVAYLKVAKRKYKETSMLVIHDTRGNIPRPE